jgi:hypothetical protein
MSELLQFSGRLRFSGNIFFPGVFGNGRTPALSPPGRAAKVLNEPL